MAWTYSIDRRPSGVTGSRFLWPCGYAGMDLSSGAFTETLITGGSISAPSGLMTKCEARGGELASLTPSRPRGLHGVVTERGSTRMGSKRPAFTSEWAIKSLGAEGLSTRIRPPLLLEATVVVDYHSLARRYGARDLFVLITDEKRQPDWDSFRPHGRPCTYGHSKLSSSMLGPDTSGLLEPREQLCRTTTAMKTRNF
jgi:hypothetical protein